MSSEEFDFSLQILPRYPEHSSDTSFVSVSTNEERDDDVATTSGDESFYSLPDPSGYPGYATTSGSEDESPPPPRTHALPQSKNKSAYRPFKDSAPTRGPSLHDQETQQSYNIIGFLLILLWILLCLLFLVVAFEITRQGSGEDLGGSTTGLYNAVTKIVFACLGWALLVVYI